MIPNSPQIQLCIWFVQTLRLCVYVNEERPCAERMALAFAYFRKKHLFLSQLLVSQLSMGVLDVILSWVVRHEGGDGRRMG